VIAQAFLVIIFCGVASSWLVLPPNKVIRGDGTLVKLQAASSIRIELRGMLGLFKNWRMLGTFRLFHSQMQSWLTHPWAALLPMFFASNYFYAYQGALNTAKFDGPTRSLNGTLEAAGAIIGALLIGYFVLDGSWLGRRNRGYLGLAVVASLTIIVW